MTYHFLCVKVMVSLSQVSHFCVCCDLRDYVYLLHTCPPRLLHANCLPFAPHRTPCRPSCTPHRRTACAPQSHNVCPPRLPHIFRSVQGRRGVGRGSKRTGAHTFCGAGFHSVGMCHLGAAGGTASDRHMPRTAFSFSIA